MEDKRQVMCGSTHEPGGHAWLNRVTSCAVQHKYRQRVWYQRLTRKGRGGNARRIYALRKPKTNIQILQQNVLLKYKYLVAFLRQHGREVYQEVRAAYVDTLARVLSSHFRAYLAAMERLQVLHLAPLLLPPFRAVLSFPFFLLLPLFSRGRLIRCSSGATRGGLGGPSSCRRFLVMLSLPFLILLPPGVFLGEGGGEVGVFFLWSQ
jgi:Vps52 / Sac2 family